MGCVIRNGQSKPNHPCRALGGHVFGAGSTRCSQCRAVVLEGPVGASATPPWLGGVPIGYMSPIIVRTLSAILPPCPANHPSVLRTRNADGKLVCRACHRNAGARDRAKRKRAA